MFDLSLSACLSFVTQNAQCRMCYCLSVSPQHRMFVCFRCIASETLPQMATAGSVPSCVLNMEERRWHDRSSVYAVEAEGNIRPTRHLQTLVIGTQMTHGAKDITCLAREALTASFGHGCKLLEDGLSRPTSVLKGDHNSTFIINGQNGLDRPTRRPSVCPLIASRARH